MMVREKIHKNSFSELMYSLLHLKCNESAGISIFGSRKCGNGPQSYLHMQFFAFFVYFCKIGKFRI